jgi:two-component system, LytTR family, sensor kinase
MKRPIDIRRFKLYLWIGLGFLLIRLLSDIARHPDLILERVLDNVWRSLYVMVFNYFLFEKAWPVMSWKRMGNSVWLVFAYIFIFSFGLYLWTRIGLHLRMFSAPVVFPDPSDAVGDQMGYSMASVFFFGTIRHIYNYIKLKQATQQLRIEKQLAELNYLKSQTNPHFLFNTLNNIYSLARDKSDLAPESILRLSKILRYMLYEAGSAYIAIGQDLKIIADYIALEQLRYDDTLRVNFNYDIEDMKQALPPLLLIPLVENAFKHGVSETRNQPFVEIHLSVKNRQLAFFVNNSTEEPAGETAVKENIGLSNLRRQLELLFTDYNLSVQQRDSVFTATLKINLASHV